MQPINTGPNQMEWHVASADPTTLEYWKDIVTNANEAVREPDFDVQTFVLQAMKDYEINPREKIRTSLVVSEVLGNALIFLDRPNTVARYEIFKRELELLRPEERSFCRECLRTAEPAANRLSGDKQQGNDGEENGETPSSLTYSQLIAILR